MFEREITGPENTVSSSSFDLSNLSGLRTQRGKKKIKEAIVLTIVLPYQEKKDSCFQLVFACLSNTLITSFPHKCLQSSKRHVKTDIVIKACTAFSNMLLENKQTNK